LGVPAGLAANRRADVVVTALQRDHPIFIFPIAIAGLVIVATLYAPRLRMETEHFLMASICCTPRSSSWRC